MTATFRTSQIVSDIEVGKPHLILVGLPGSGKSAVGRGACHAAETVIPRFRPGDRASPERIDLGDLRGARRAVFPSAGSRADARAAPMWEHGGGAGRWLGHQQRRRRGHSPTRRVDLLEGFARDGTSSIGFARAARPLLSRPDPLAELKRLLTEREKLYAQADHVVSAEVFDVKRVVDKLVELASTIKAG